ncbi:triose-phosphate isomerase [Candidatus Woesearchaeota archaeon]|nr:triose-phosphate isomerase [Candidatus Woesearchaeota archaeon]
MAKLIAANWKMNKTVDETVDFISGLKKSKIPKEMEIAVFPPFTSLHAASKLLEKSKISLGAQNMYFEEKGAFTGEISPLMLKELGCRYVLIGHSERRHIIAEKNKDIKKKFSLALKWELIPVLCVGETKKERKSGKTMEVIESQLKGIQASKGIVIAYEPVWAIGTGENATAKQASEMHSAIRRIISRNSIRIIYGGSVSPENSSNFLREKEIDGLLVGGASLDLKKFTYIINS